MNAPMIQLGAALCRLAATELLDAFSDAPATPLTAEQLAAKMQLIAVRFESPGKVRLVYDGVLRKHCFGFVWRIWTGN
jgi:hypothetical protein